VGVVDGELDDPNEAHAYLAAISVGQLAFLVYGHLLGAPNPHQLATALSAKLVQIWPPESEVLSWPPLRHWTTLISRRHLLRSASQWAAKARFRFSSRVVWAVESNAAARGIISVRSCGLSQQR
jgi:hypothetical protein